MVLYRSKNDVFVVRKCKFLEVLDFLLLLLVLLLELPRGAAGRLDRGGGCGLLLLDRHRPQTGSDLSFHVLEWKRLTEAETILN